MKRLVIAVASVLALRILAEIYAEHAEREAYAALRRCAGKAREVC